MGETAQILTGTIAEGGQRLDKALADAAGLSRERVKALIGEGAVTLDGRVVAQVSLKATPGMAWAIHVPWLIIQNQNPWQLNSY